jgi:hypothetical protein
MQVIYTRIPETNRVPREYIVAAILPLLFMVPLVSVLALLYFYISTLRSMCSVPNMALFCSSLTSWCPGMLLTCFLNDFEMVPVAIIIIIIVVVVVVVVYVVVVVIQYYYCCYSCFSLIRHSVQIITY